MNIWQLALQNIKGNWRNYKVFFLSSCFAVFASYAYMFCHCASVYARDDVVSKRTLGTYHM